jgi:hypothetical protein
MEMRNEQQKDENLEAPPKLVAALRQLPTESLFVPPTLDEALMKAARQYLGQAERKRPGWFRLIPWTVATAGLAAAVLLSYPYVAQFLGFGHAKEAVRRGWENHGDSSIQPQPKALANAREDLNRDGNVDILDAFVLAKKLQGPPLSDPKLDMNGDGVIDRRDVETIAAHAVSLGKGGRS